VKCRGGLSNKVSIIIRRYTDQMKFAAYTVFFVYIILSCCLGSILYHCIVCRFCMLLFNFVINYVFFYCYVIYSN